MTSNRAYMQYETGSPGRIFYLRFDHGEDLLKEIQAFAERQHIMSGIIHLIGAVSEGSIVTGPRATALPPDQVWHSLAGAHDLVGTGIIRSGENGIKVHLHASAGREDSVFVGCFRKNIRIYILIEAVIMEFSGFSIREVYDDSTGLFLPELQKPGEPEFT